MKPGTLTVLKLLEPNIFTISMALCINKINLRVQRDYFSSQKDSEHHQLSNCSLYDKIEFFDLTNSEFSTYYLRLG